MKRILVIDDDRRVLALLREILTEAGYDVTEADDGKRGLACFRERPADLVITDIIMPGQEGIETIDELHAEYPRVPILAISGGSPKGVGSYLETAVALGASKALAKPFGFNELLAAVHELLAGPDG
jgi:CheY-like chemotaxis protein